MLEISVTLIGLDNKIKRNGNVDTKKSVLKHRIVNEHLVNPNNSDLKDRYQKKTALLGKVLSLS